MDADDRARKLQRHVRIDEAEQLRDGLSDYDDGQIRQAIVHSRQDIVILVSYLSSANYKLKVIAGLLFVAVGLLAYIAYQIKM